MQAPHRDEAFEIRRYVAVLRRRRMSIIVCVLLTMALAVGLSLAQDPVYQASGKILLTSTSSDELANVFGNQRANVADRVATEIEVMQSQTIEDAVSEELGGAYQVKLTGVEDTSVIEIKATASSPEEAARIVNTFAETYIDYRRSLVIDSLTSRAQRLDDALAVLRVELVAARSPVQEAQNRLAELPPTPIGETTSLERQAAELALARAESDAAPMIQSIDAQILSKNQELDVIRQALGLSESSGAQSVTPATPPSNPISPKPVRNGILAGIIGLILGVALALVREQFDDAVRTKDELEALMGGRPVLGLIPHVAGWRDRGQAQLESIAQPNSVVAEAYRTLRTSVQFLSVDQPVRRVQVTSPYAGEGKTTTVANLGVALARAGQRVAVVCCDLRRPRIESFFGLPRDPGFTSVLLGEVSLAEALQPVPDENRLFLLASGPPPPNPSELLSTKRAHRLLDELADSFDVVLIDAPPVLPVTDSLLLSHMVDATILVASAGRTSRRAIRRAVELLEQVDAHIEGSVLNGAPSGDSYGMGYGYGYGSYERYAYRPYVMKPEKERRFGRGKAAKAAEQPADQAS